MGGLMKYLPGCWPWTLILLISASQVARIIRVSHRCPAKHFFWDKFPLCSPGWLWALNPPAAVSWVLGLQVSFVLKFKKYNILKIGLQIIKNICGY
jgi:hypothetical protein